MFSYYAGFAAGTARAMATTGGRRDYQQRTLIYSSASLLLTPFLRRCFDEPWALVMTPEFV